MVIKQHSTLSHYVKIYHDIYFFYHDQHDLNQGKEDFLKYFAAEVNLLAAMCSGNNEEVIKALQSEITAFGVTLSFELVMTAVIDHKLRKDRPELVAALIELFKGRKMIYLC